MILIALGSNLGNRAEYLAQARMVLMAHDINIVKESRPIETPALLPDGAPEAWNTPFLNQVIAVETPLEPLALLACLKLIETGLGRAQRPHWAPREIDLDLLAYHDTILLSDTLTLPHPAMDSRPFVLRPLAEIAPNWRHPVLDQTAAEMLEAL